MCSCYQLCSLELVTYGCATTDWGKRSTWMAKKAIKSEAFDKAQTDSSVSSSQSHHLPKMLIPVQHTSMRLQRNFHQKTFKGNMTISAVTTYNLMRELLTKCQTITFFITNRSDKLPWIPTDFTTIHHWIQFIVLTLHHVDQCPRECVIKLIRQCQK